MSNSRELVKTKAQRKGMGAFAAGLGTAGAVAFGVAVGSPLLAVGLGMAGVAYTAKKTYDWLRYRGEWGLKF